MRDIILYLYEGFKWYRIKSKQIIAAYIIIEIIYYLAFIKITENIIDFERMSINLNEITSLKIVIYITAFLIHILAEIIYINCNIADFNSREINFVQIIKSSLKVMPFYILYSITEAIIIFMGIMFFIVPGIIFFCMFFYGKYLIASNTNIFINGKLGLSNIFINSIKIINGNKLRFLMLYIVSFMISYTVSFILENVNFNIIYISYIFSTIAFLFKELFSIRIYSAVYCDLIENQQSIEKKKPDFIIFDIKDNITFFESRWN